MSDPFPAELLPVRFRRDCPQMEAASFYWCAWYVVGQLDEPRAGNVMRELPQYRRAMLAAFHAKDWTAADVHQLAGILRRDALDTARRKRDLAKAREKAGRAAFARGDYDWAKVIPLRRPSADRR